MRKNEKFKKRFVKTSDVKKMVELRNEGLSYEKIGEELNFSRQAISSHLRNNINVDPERRLTPKQRFDKNIMKACDYMIINKCPLAFVSKKFSLSHIGIRKAIEKKHGEIFYKNLINICNKKRMEKIKGSKKEYKSRLPKGKINEIINLVKLGYTYNSIADKIGVDHATVKTISMKIGNISEKEYKKINKSLRFPELKEDRLHDLNIIHKLLWNKPGISAGEIHRNLKSYSITATVRLIRKLGFSYDKDKKEWVN